MFLIYFFFVSLLRSKRIDYLLFIMWHTMTFVSYKLTSDITTTFICSTILQRKYCKLKSFLISFFNVRKNKQTNNFIHNVLNNFSLPITWPLPFSYGDQTFENISFVECSSFKKQPP